MNFRQIIKSLTGAKANPLKFSVYPSDFNDGDYDLKAEQMPVGLSDTRVVHTETFSQALKIAEKFSQLEEYEERIAFWNTHPTVFMPATVIVFDTTKEEYWPYYGKLQESLYDSLEGNSERFKAYWITPGNVDEFWVFLDFCIENSPSVNTIPTIMDEDHYWKRIKQHLLPEEFLTNLLKAAEDHRNHIGKLPTHWGAFQVTDEMARKYFFFYGNQDACEGDLGVLSGSTFNLFSIFHKITVRPISDYGQIFFQYWDGYHTAMMIAFLREQKKRLDRGEDIRKPVVDFADQQSKAGSGVTSKVSTKLTSQETSLNNEETGSTDSVSFIFIKEIRRDTILRQLGYHLDEPNKIRLKNLLNYIRPDSKIEIKIDAKVLADYFRQIYRVGDINNDDYNKDQLGDWLANWFIRTSGKQFKPESFKDYLHIKDNNAKITTIKQRIIYPK